MEKRYQVDPDYKNLSWIKDRKRLERSLERKKTPENKALEYFFKYINPMEAIKKEIEEAKNRREFSDYKALKLLGVDMEAIHRKELNFLKNIKKCLEPIISKPGCF